MLLLSLSLEFYFFRGLTRYGFETARFGLKPITGIRLTETLTEYVQQIHKRSAASVETGLIL